MDDTRSLTRTGNRTGESEELEVWIGLFVQHVVHTLSGRTVPRLFRTTEVRTPELVGLGPLVGRRSFRHLPRK